MRRTPATVAVVAGLHEELQKRHRKDPSRAAAAWRALVAKGVLLEQDTTLGKAIPRDRWPDRFAGYPSLYRLALPNAFRALYTVFYDPDPETHIVSIEWIGDHKEYDRLFGYQTG